MKPVEKKMGHRVWPDRCRQGWVLGILLIPILLPGGSGAQTTETKRPGLNAAPPIETKVRQVPKSGSYAVPFWKQHWELARKAVLQKDQARAVKDYRQALALKPNLDEARLELVRVLESLHRYEEATVELEIFIEHQPHHLKVQQEMGDLLMLRREFRRAAYWYQRVLQRDPDNLGVRLSLASAFSQTNELEKAMIEWRQVLIRDPQQVDARLHLAEGLRGTRRFDEAIFILEGLVKQFPKQTPFKKKLAQTLVAAQRGREALPALQELNRQDPGDLEVQLLLAQVLAAGKQYEQSLPYLETFLKKKPENTGALLEKARILLNQGNTREALATFERLQRLEPDNLELQRELADIYYARGQAAEALVAYQSLSRREPRDHRLLEKIGNLYLQQKDFARAIQAYEGALKIEPEDVYAQLGLARAFNLSGQKDRAVPYYRSLLEIRDNQEIKLELANLFLEIGQPEEAFRIYDRILQENPDLWAVRYRWATALYGQKDYSRAAVHLETLIRSQPQNSGAWTLSGYNALHWGDWRGARKAFQKALLLGEDRGNLLIRLGEIYRLLGRPQTALSYLEWAETLKPTDREIPLQRLLALIDSGQFGRAKKILDDLPEGPADHFAKRRAQSLWLAALDRREEFLHLSRQLEQDFPGEQARIFLDRAAFFAACGSVARESALLQAARERSPQNLEARRKMGALWVRERNWSEAETLYRQMVEENVLRDEAYLQLGFIHMARDQYPEAREFFWKALAFDPDSLPARYWLGNLEVQELARPLAERVEKNLVDFARTRDLGLLELGDLEALENHGERALERYREAVEIGRDDAVIPAALRIVRHRLGRQEYDQTELFLEDLQKRYPQNQKITRALIRTYGLNKAYEAAIKQLDSLLKAEDPRDPVLNIQKARFLERWNKHDASQKTFALLLRPAVDRLLWEKLKDAPWFFRLQENAPLKTLIDQQDPESLYSWYEAFSREIREHPLKPDIQGPLERLIFSLEATALVQKKVYLEMEAKDRLWRGQWQGARIFLEELKALDPENEDVIGDLERSHRLQE